MNATSSQPAEFEDLDVRHRIVGDVDASQAEFGSGDWQHCRRRVRIYGRPFESGD